MSVSREVRWRSEGGVVAQLGRVWWLSKGGVVAQWLVHQTVALRSRVQIWHIPSLRLTVISWWVATWDGTWPSAVLWGATEEKKLQKRASSPQNVCKFVSKPVWLQVSMFAYGKLNSLLTFLAAVHLLLPRGTPSPPHPAPLNRRWGRHWGWPPVPPYFPLTWEHSTVGVI